MFPTTADSSSFTVSLSDEQATMKLMRDIASIIAPGDTITLSGDTALGSSSDPACTMMTSPGRSPDV